MKTNKTAYHILLFFGVLLMAYFGSGIARAITPSKSGAGNFLLIGYSMGFMMFCGAMFTQLSSQVKELQSKVDKLESTKT
jgi:hypothetical protein